MIIFMTGLLLFSFPLAIAQRFIIAIISSPPYAGCFSLPPHRAIIEYGKEVILMDRLQRLSELAQIQAKFMPQMEAVQAVYQGISPKTLSHLRQISVSPTYRYLLSLPAHHAEAARITQDAEALMNSFLLAFEKLSDEEQRSVIDDASTIEIPRAVFEQAMNETTPSENPLFRSDVPCAANILPKNIDSTWMQIRKAMYPIVHGNLRKH